MIDDDDKDLAFAIRGNLANALVRGGHARSAATELEQARQIIRSIADPLGATKLDWIEGDLNELQGDLETAKRYYRAARAGFRDAAEARYGCIVTVDLMLVYSLQSDWESVGVLASETFPMLGSLNLHSETVTALGLLVRAVKAGSLSRRLLNDLRIALRQDPLAL